MFCRNLLAGLSLLSLATPMALAQSPIYGLDVRLQRFFTSTADANFVTGFTSIAATGALPVFALDFDETATTLWGIQNTTNQYGTFDLTTGVFTPVGTVTITSGTANVGASGLTCAVDGTWYMCSVVGADTRLYVGDITTGQFAEVGVIVTGLGIDISINSQGQLYAYNISNDALYSVDTTTGLGTLIGLSGFATNFAQGMDFDWSTDTLYATLYTGGGTGQFATFNLTTGVATSLAVTTPLNAEMEIAVKVPAPSNPGPVSYCTAGTTTNGCAAVITADNNPSVTAANACNISVANVEGNKSGLIFYSISGQSAGSWNGSSFLCVKSPTQRTPTQTSTGTAGLCDGTMSLDWNAYQASNPGAVGQPWSAGDVVQVQAWFRDPPAGKSTNLSDAIEMTYLP